MVTPGDILTEMAAKPARRIVGIMSGTSYDGASAAVVEVVGSGEHTRVRLLSFVTVPYSDDLRERAFALFRSPATLAELHQLDVAFAERFAGATLEAIRQAGLTPEDIDLVSSSGAPMPVIRIALGSGPMLAERTGVPVLDDLRASDAAAGGPGAPLSPYVDWILFHHPERGRIVQNIGGIANLGFLPAGKPPSAVIGFDTGPGNMVIDALAHRFSGGRHRFDPDGTMAAAGRVDEGLLRELLAHPFIQADPPKAATRTHFGHHFADRVLERGRALGLSDADVMATATALTVEAIALAYERWVFPRGRVDEVIVGGGGARNPTLMEFLRRRVAPVPVRRHEDLGINGDARESISWAILANEWLFGRPGNLPQVTGARHPVVMGRFTLGRVP